MLLNQHLFNRALIKKKLSREKRGLDALTPKTSLDGLSINLQKELLKEEKPDEFKKVVIEDKKQSKKRNIDGKEDKKIIIKEQEKISDEEQEKISDEEQVEIKEDYFPDLEADDDFELIDDPIKEENNLLEEADKELKNEQSGGDNKDVKKVVVSFF